MAPPLLELRDLTLAVGQTGQRVVDGISFTVGSGEIVGIVVNPAPARPWRRGPLWR